MSDGRPLGGITAIEIGTAIAGPYAGAILAGLGAEVIKIEAAMDGDPFRKLGGPRIDGMPALFQALNGGKRSIRADLSDPKQCVAVRNLALAKADIVLQNMRPGAADRLELGAGSLLADKPGLIYCNLGAYGREGPMRQLPGYDPLMQAFGGIVSVTGTEAAPARVGVSLVDLGTAMWAAVGILAALHRRDETGCGGVVDVSLFETTLGLLSLPIAQFEAAGVIPERTGLRGPFVAPNRAYEAADGLLVITAVSEAQFRRLAEALDSPEWADDPRFADAGSRMENETALADAINAVLGQRTRREWAEILNGLDVPNAPVHGLDEVVAHAQTMATGMLKARGEGGARLVGLPLSIDGRRACVAATAPAHGSDDQLLFEFME